VRSRNRQHTPVAVMQNRIQHLAEIHVQFQLARRRKASVTGTR
jgi:hypothetical protein